MIAQIKLCRNLPCVAFSRSGEVSLLTVSTEPSSIYILRVPGSHWRRTGMASAVAIAVEKPLGGGRHFLGDATQLHQSIIASSLPGTVYRSLTIGYPSG